MKLSKKALAYGVVSSSVLALAPDAAQATRYHATIDKSPVKQDHKARQRHQAKPLAVEPISGENVITPAFLQSTHPIAIAAEPETAEAQHAEPETAILSDTKWLGAIKYKTV